MPQPVADRVILVTSAGDEHLVSIREAARRAGAELRHFDPGAVRGVRPPEASCCVVVFALEAEDGGVEGDLAFVRLLSAAGFAVLVYQDGVHSWSVGTCCRPLLAGARCVLDSADPSFLTELQGRLASLLATERARHEDEEHVHATMAAAGLVGRSASMTAVFRRALRVAPLTDLPVLLTGETGTGKELLARVIHRLDPRRGRAPFVALNCAAVSHGLAESELFGHRRGAFTGADRDRRGLIRAADGGVLFLDEVAELDLDLQAKLLRVLQENRVMAVGHDQELPIDVRVIAASHRDLGQMVSAGRFREDLLHRINVLPVPIPPLRNRPEDLAPLVAHFLKKHRGLNPRRAPVAGPDFLAALRAVSLPGNARQVENLVRRALAQKEDDTALSLGDLPSEIWRELATTAVPADGEPHPPTSMVSVGTTNPLDLRHILDANGWRLDHSLAVVESLLLQAALERAHGNQTQTARLLGITPRSVYTKLRKHHLAS